MAVTYHNNKMASNENIENGHAGMPLYPGQQSTRHIHGNYHHGLPTPINMGHLDPNLTGVVNQFHGLGLAAQNMAAHGVNMAQTGAMPQHMGSGPAFMMPQDAQFLLHHVPSAPHHLPMDGFNPNASPYVAGQSQIAGYMGVPVMPFTPGRSVAPMHGRMDRGSDLPGLDTRRGSYSTTESTPATPFYGTMSHRDHGPRVAGLDRSTYTTPSPQQLGLQGGDGKAKVVSLPLDFNMDEILAKDPPIPKAVPAVFTPPGQIKSLEQSLDNRIPGNRNVYIRGLHPTTDDALLHSYTARFGAVETSKAIIDTATGACKGFGFAKFCDIRHSELCIRAFHHLGYEVGFARESFNSRLKAEGDEMSTNLYISNLPRNVGETELAAIFSGFEILSSKILRDSMGNSRGVGFARFESRDICDEIINTLQGRAVGSEGLQMNIRYADTPSQKELKRITAERRQFRTNEYNIGAYGTSIVGFQPSMFNQQGWRRSGQPIHQSGQIHGYAGSNATSANLPATILTYGTSQTGSDCNLRSQAKSEIIVRTSTPSQASDEAVSAHAEPTVVHGSTQSSPSAK